jgi:dolichol-phosphate mannosyltransferase
VQNTGANGFGRAVVCGLDHSRGDAVVIMMADASDSPADAVTYWQLLNEGHDCAFGSRFVEGGEVIDYPRVKLLVNRLANFLVRVGFNISLNDTTNAFKAYRRTTIDGCRPFLAPHFNLTVEIPLKAIVRGYNWAVIPISWRNRKHGVAKLKIKEMGSRYFFICMYVWLEKYFSRGDYRRKS